MKEHKDDIRILKDTSKIAQHVAEKQHNMDFDNVKILCHESNWRRRIIKESLHTHNSFGKAINDVKHQLNVVV